MRELTLKVYTAKELQELFPDSYNRAYLRFKARVCRYGIPWNDEIMASLKKCVECLCGNPVRNYSIGPWSPSWLEARTTLVVEEELAGTTVVAYVRRRFTEAGFKLGEGPDAEVKFNGDCPWTGVCFDDRAAEHVWKAALSGDSLCKAVESLADWASEALEEEQTHAESEEEFLERESPERLFFENGTQVDCALLKESVGG